MREYYNFKNQYVSNPFNRVNDSGDVIVTPYKEPAGRQSYSSVIIPDHNFSGNKTILICSNGKVTGGLLEKK